MEIRLSVETARFVDARPAGFVVYRVAGVLLPSGLKVGETVLTDRIPLAESATTAFPQKGWEEVAGDPEAHMERGIRDGNPVRVLVAAGCLPPGSRFPAGKRLARVMREGGLRPAVETSIRAALRFLGDDPEADAWGDADWDAREPTPEAAGDGR